MKYKVGDTVKIKSDLKTNINYGGYNLNPTGSMTEYLGKETTITKIRDGSSYDLDIDDGHYYWTDEMLEDIITFDQLKQSPIEYILLDDIPKLITWLQNVYYYCTDLKENMIEYVDWKTARNHMEQGAKCKFQEVEYFIKEGDLYWNFKSKPEITSISLPMLDMKKWILL